MEASDGPPERFQQDDAPAQDLSPAEPPAQPLGRSPQPPQRAAQPPQPAPTPPAPPIAQPPIAQPPTAQPPTAEPPTAEPPTAQPPSADLPAVEPVTAQPPTMQPAPAQPLPQAEPGRARPVEYYLQQDTGGDGYEYHSSELDLVGDPDDDRWSIRCLDVHKRLGGVPVLNGLNVSIPDETITVVLGPSGTGKSVLIKHLIGLMFPDSGDIVVKGLSVPSLTMPDLLALRRRIGVLFQDGALFGSMTVFNNVAFPLRQHTDMTEAQISRVVKQRLSDVGLAEAIDAMPSQLSGGMRKRAGFARALVMEPEIVIFDEPDSGLDPVRTALLCELIQEMHSIHGGTYIVVTHDIASARRIGEYLALLWRGRIVEAGDAERMFSSDNPFVRQFLSGSADGPLRMD